MDSSKMPGAVLVIIAATSSLCAVAARAASYTFTNIVDTSGSFDYFEDVAVNNLGTVAFSARVRGQTWGGVYTGDGGSLTTIADTNSFPVALKPAINDQGTVVFRGAPGFSLYAGSGGAVTPVLMTNDTISWISYSHPINNSSVVATIVGFTDGRSSVVTVQNGQLTVVYDNSRGFTNFAEAGISDSGLLAINAQNTNGWGLYTGNGGPLTTIAPSGGTFSQFALSDTSVNNAGIVAFLAYDGSGGQFFDHVCIGDGGPVTTLADVSGSFYGFNTPSVNELGEVVFSAGLRTGGNGIYRWAGGPLDQVLVPGDALFGGVVSGAGPAVVNDLGQIAFLYALADGASGVALATPIPEPATFTLLALGGVGLCRRRVPRR